MALKSIVPRLAVSTSPELLGMKVRCSHPGLTKSKILKGWAQQSMF